jgi:hypothetical protein
VDVTILPLLSNNYVEVRSEGENDSHVDFQSSSSALSAAELGSHDWFHFHIGTMRSSTNATFSIRHVIIIKKVKL